MDVRDLGGHLLFTGRARAGTLSERVGEVTVVVAAVGALPLGFQVKLGLLRGKYLPAGLHDAEASYVSSSALFLLVCCMLLRPLMCLLPRLLVPLGLLLYGQCGPPKCLLPTLPPA